MVRTILAVAAVAVSFAISPSPVATQARSDSATSARIGRLASTRPEGGVGQVSSSIREGRQNMADFNRKIAAARQRYFALIPDKPGVEEAGAAFFSLLQAKDIGLMSEQIMLDVTKSLLGNVSRGPKVAEIVGGKSRWDGGLAPVLRPAFDAWMRQATAGQNEAPRPDIQGCGLPAGLHP